MDPDCYRFGRHDCLGDPLPQNLTTWAGAGSEVHVLNATLIPRWTGRRRMYCKSVPPPSWAGCRPEDMVA